MTKEETEKLMESVRKGPCLSVGVTGLTLAEHTATVSVVVMGLTESTAMGLTLADSTATVSVGVMGLTESTATVSVGVMGLTLLV